MRSDLRRLRLALHCAVVCASALIVSAQVTPEAFVAASIRPVAADGPARYVGAPNRFHNPDATLVALVAFASDVQEFQVDGGPEWTRRARFDVNAVSEGEPSPPEMRRLVQRLLIDRFGLSTVMDVREMPVYALRPIRPGAARLTPAREDSCRAGASASSDGGVPPCRTHIARLETTARLVMDGTGVPDLAKILERFVGRPVLDETGLRGRYNVELQFAADQITWRAPVPATPVGAAPDGLSLVTALDEQLGLRLVPRRGSVTMVRITAAHLPTDN